MYYLWCSCHESRKNEKSNRELAYVNKWLAYVIDTGSRQNRTENNRVRAFEMKFVDFFPVVGKRTKTHLL
jgi:hypothetical protein